MYVMMIVHLFLVGKGFEDYVSAIFGQRAGVSKGDHKGRPYDAL